ncbi:2,3-bisphosphoglycerate-dependent phosphoglycerate mutase [Companilactobacillus sp. RD055328]|uniref:2,3-bisphosphoglycerate-dependent phosphoglycerate mutase n=1 Tax=Companilactobacillus sp. RD055328 TaxID=2916634 RepID=UPI001FC8A198|nr:2,3-diphosphoglycerate-dependent phosphoglycerate mutase [Companilactobacillus sp. RD055328]GKQ42183.1 2,3-bisphosphoglycerate-dependent phosphoglycerate mutase [Companilactobacillus sp. RD055328]
MVSLILVRHGQSKANEENIYTGWTDSPLTVEGENQAIQAGLKLKDEYHDSIDGYHTSVLSRAIKTTYLIQEQLDDLYKPLAKNWRLNERHYGALRGLNKDDTRITYGKKQVAIWRRSYDARPPELKQADLTTGRYKYLNPRSMPTSESLKDATNRVIPYYLDKVVPRLLEGKNQMIVAHGSTIRALVKYIEEISDTDIDGVEIDNAAPVIYKFDEHLNLCNKKG